MSTAEGRWTQWMVFYIDPTEPQGSPWQTAGSIAGPMTADEAIAATVGRRFPDQPYWAFALDKGEHGSFYDLHYPPGVAPRANRRPIGPSGYHGEPPRSAHETAHADPDPQE